MGNYLTTSPAAAALTRQELRTMLLRGGGCEAPLSPVTEKKWSEADVSWERLSVATYDEADAPSQRRLPLLVARPSTEETTPLPVVIFAHGTASGKASAIVTSQMARYARDFGAASVSFDSRYHGQRAGIDDDALADLPKVDRERKYVDALIAAWRHKSKERPFIFDSAADAMRVVDFVESRPSEFDATRVGATGISLGGMITWFAAAADERVKVAAPAIGVQHFAYAYEEEQYQGRVESIQRLFDVAAEDLGKTSVDREVFKKVLDAITPGIFTQYDAPRSLPLIAPRPLLIANGELDHRCPIAAVEKLHADLLRGAYADAPQNLSLVVGEGIYHSISDDMFHAIDQWFIKFLDLSRSSRDVVDDKSDGKVATTEEAGGEASSS